MSNIFMRFPKGKKRALTLSYDDATDQDIRLIELMKKHGLKGTFNVNSGCYTEEGTVYKEGQYHRRMTKKQAIDLYKNSGMEIAVHGLTHPFLEQLPPSMCTYEIYQDRVNLEEEYGQIVRGMAYPYGRYNDAVVDAVKSCSIVYSRTIESTGKFSIPTDWLRWKATCHHADPNLMELAHKFVEKERKEAPALFYVWGHTFEFERDNNWEIIEEFAEYIGNREEIWYATNIEVYDYVHAYNQLVFSANGGKVYNPTVFDIYFEKDKKIYCVKPNECKNLDVNYWTQSPKNIYVAAHRGWSEKYPENTMESFQAAEAIGVDQLELDVRVTKDNELVIIHDATVDRTTNGTGLVCEHTLDELKSLDAGSHKGEEFSGTQIPTFIEFMDWIKYHPTMTLDVELKEWPTEGHEEVAYDVCDRVLKIIDDYGFTDRVVLNTWSGKLHEYIYEKYGEKYRLHSYFPQSCLGEIEKEPYAFPYCCCMFAQDENGERKRGVALATKEEFDEMASRGVQPWAGAGVKTEELVDMAIERGAYLITCNNPDEILGWLRKKGYHR